MTNVGTTTLEFSDSLVYQNNSGIWPTEKGFMKFKNIIFADHWQDPAMTMDTDGAMVSFENNLFVGRTRSPGPGESPASNGLPPALKIQYTGQAALSNPTFVNYGGTGLLSANDINVEWQAEFFIAGARLINTDPVAMNMHDMAITMLTDTSWGLPVGVYVSAARPQLVELGSPKIVVADGEDGTFLRTQMLRGYGLLRTEIPGGDSFSFGWHSPAFEATRSDGLTFTEPDENGPPGFRVICGGDYSYELKQAPTSAMFFLSLDSLAIPMPPGVKQTAVVSLPLDKAPASVARIAELDEDTVAESGSSQLKPAATQSAFDSAPATTFYYDPATRRLHLLADANWLVIRR